VSLGQPWTWAAMLDEGPVGPKGIGNAADRLEMRVVARSPCDRYTARLGQ